MGTVQPDMLVDGRVVRVFNFKCIGRLMDSVEIRFDDEVQYAWTAPAGAEVVGALLSHAIERPTVVKIQVQTLGEGDWSLLIEPK